VNRRWWCFAAIAALIFSATASPNLYARASGNRSFTGEVADAMCGRKHMEDEPSAECTHACVAHGSKFALIVGDKIYPPSGVKRRPSERRYKPYMVVLLVRTGETTSRQICYS
jgi:hypothetical protein